MGCSDCDGGVLKAQDTAVELYQLAALMLGNENEALDLVESTVAEVEVDPCEPEEGAIDTARHHLVEAAVARMKKADPESFAAPVAGKGPATCIEDDDLSAAGVTRTEIAELVNDAANATGNGSRLRAWLDELPLVQRAIFVQRAVLGWDNGVTAASLGNGADGRRKWSAAQVSESFRQALCSLANALVHSEAQKVGA